MSDKAVFRACYSDWKLIRTRKCVQLVFEVPVEESDKAYAALGGMPNSGEESWVAIARLDPNAKVEEHKPAFNRYAQRAAIIGNDPRFWKYMYDHHGWTALFQSKEERLEYCAQFVREKCGVKSRAEILPNTEAATRFDLLESSYIAWRDCPEMADAS